MFFFCNNKIILIQVFVNNWIINIIMVTHATNIISQGIVGVPKDTGIVMIRQRWSCELGFNKSDLVRLKGLYWKEFCAILSPLTNRAKSVQWWVELGIVLPGRGYLEHWWSLTYYGWHGHTNFPWIYIAGNPKSNEATIPRKVIVRSLGPYESLMSNSFLCLW